MSEKQPEYRFEPLNSKLVKSSGYQNAALELLYNCMASSNEDMSVEQPAANEPERIARLEPYFSKDNLETEDDAEWEAIEIVIYPEGHSYEFGGDLLATVELNQFIDDDSVELVKLYQISFNQLRYRVVKSNILYFGANMDMPLIELGNHAIAEVKDIEELDEIISLAS